MSFQNILYNKDEHLLWITLNRPEVLNALNSALWRELHQALTIAEKDKDIRVLVITGTGRAFSAGDDIREVVNLRGSSEIKDFLLNCAAPAIWKIIELPKPVIAAVNGLAYGGGCEIAMVCDIVIASENASFAIPEARIGAYPPIATTIGAYIIGKLHTSMLALTGESIASKEAERIGLINKVVSAEELKSYVEKVAEKIILSPPISIETIKKTLNKRFQREELKQAVMRLVALLERKEAKEGHSAFINKRPPSWSIAKK